MNQTKFEWTPTFWQGWRESNNPYRQYKSDRDRRLVLELLDLHDGERVLEVGCGYGWISQVLWDTAKINWFGVDQSPEMIQHLRQIPLHGDAPASMADAVRLRAVGWFAALTTLFRPTRFQSKFGIAASKVSSKNFVFPGRFASC